MNEMTAKLFENLLKLFDVLEDNLTITSMVPLEIYRYLIMFLSGATQQ